MFGIFGGASLVVGALMLGWVVWRAWRRGELLPNDKSRV